MFDRYECEKRLRQDAEDKHCQILDKLGFDTRMHDQVASHTLINKGVLHERRTIL